MKPGEAMEALGLLGSALDEMTPSGVKSAWAMAVKYHHPDTAAACDDPARGMVGLVTIGTLTKARDLLLEVITGKNRACILCKGLGKVRGRFGARDCIACQGTGDKIDR